MNAVRRTILMFAVAACAFTATANPALAEPISPAGYYDGCYGNGTSRLQPCTGKDPNEMGCGSGATTLESFTFNLVTIELRYSSSCYAAWTRYEVHAQTFQSTVFIRGSSSTYSKNIANYAGEKNWTKMISFSQTVKSCLQWYNPKLGGDYYEKCTPSR